MAMDPCRVRFNDFPVASPEVRVLLSPKVGYHNDLCTSRGIIVQRCHILMLHHVLSSVYCVYRRETVYHTLQPETSLVVSTIRSSVKLTSHCNLEEHKGARG